jgi:hypothetical protein
LADPVADKRAGQKLACRDSHISAVPLDLVEAGLSPTQAAKQVELGRATAYREMRAASVQRAA